MIQTFFSFLVGVLRELIGGNETKDEERSDAVFLCGMSIIGQCLHRFTARRIISALGPESFDPADIERIADHITRFSLRGIQKVNSEKSKSEQDPGSGNREKVESKKPKMA